MPDPPNSHDFVYVHTDIPPRMTIREWRVERAARGARLRDAHRQARPAGLPAMLIKGLRRLLGELGLRAMVRALPGILDAGAVEAHGYPRIYWRSEDREDPQSG